MDDRRIGEDFLRGDPSAVRHVDGWIDAVLRQSFGSLRPDWDDLRQEIKVRLLGNLARNRFDGRSALRTYVHRIAKNVCIDEARRARRHREKPLEPTEVGTIGAVEDEGNAPIARETLANLLAGLGEEDRLLLRLVFEENRSYAEVASLLGVATGTVKSRMSRCRDRILTHRRRLPRKGGCVP